MGWIDMATKNLLLNSQARCLRAAMREWRATDRCNVRDDSDGTCELCEHEAISYEFEIINDLTRAQMETVGSVCITKFIPVFLSGVELLDPERQRAHLSRLAAEALDRLRKRRACAALESLAQRDSRFPGHGRAETWGTGYTVRQMLWIIRSARTHRVAINSSDFTVILRRGRHKLRMDELSSEQYSLSRLALTPAQRGRFDPVSSRLDFAGVIRLATADPDTPFRAVSEAAALTPRRAFRRSPALGLMQSHSGPPLTRASALGTTTARAMRSAPTLVA